MGQELAIYRPQKDAAASHLRHTEPAARASITALDRLSATVRLQGASRSVTPGMRVLAVRPDGVALP